MPEISLRGVFIALLVVVISSNLQLWLGVYEMSGGGGTRPTLGWSRVTRYLQTGAYVWVLRSTRKSDTSDASLLDARKRRIFRTLSLSLLSDP